LLDQANYWTQGSSVIKHSKDAIKGLALYPGDKAINGPVHWNSNLLGKSSLKSQLPVTHCLK